MSRDGIFKRKGAFYISFIDATGRRRQLKTSAPTLTQAREIRAQKLIDAEKQRVFGYVPPTKDTFAEFAPRYLSSQKSAITPRAYERTRGIVDVHLCGSFGPMRLADIRRKDIERYIENRSKVVKPGSVIRELNVLKHLLGVAVNRELIAVNHAHGVKLPKAPAGRVRYIQPQEFRAVLIECPQWLRPIVLLLLATGMRRSEALGMRWLDVDRQGNRILLPRTKNGKMRTVQLNALACKVIDSLTRSTTFVFPPNEQVTPENVSLAFLRAARRARITDFRLHDLRHTCASWLSMSGASLQTVALQLGHTDLRMTARYSHLSPEFLQKAVRQLDDVFLPGLADHDEVTIESINHCEPVLATMKQLPAQVIAASAS